ncbi:MAG: UvrD-helicase domain-containing protein [Symbiobacteriaceae bacterium]|nr:UvrD-helicase domain-containing protein [Symbiobacteriaceae bacterium]
MRATEHPDYRVETAHLERTLQQIILWQDALARSETMARSEIEEILSQLADARKPEDMTMSQMLEMEKLQNSLSRRATLELARKDPYFGRLDLTLLEYTHMQNLTFEKIATADSPGGERRQEALAQTVYLGKVGVGDENGQSQLVIDWRAPIADLYYAGIHGRTHFEGPYGPIEVDLHLLRRLLVKAGQLLEIADQEEASGIDDYLLSRLRENAGTGMKDIIATIQQNQNEIIRLPAGQPVIVQGAAGSGKTSVALHRLSYLLYIRRKSIFPEDTLIITPSRLFFGYIASVMPDLDIKRCRQMTFTEIALEELADISFDCTSSTAWMTRYLDQSPGAAATMQLELEMLKAKGSIAMLRGIDNYVTFLEGVVLPNDDMKTASGLMLVPLKEMELRYQDLRFLTLEKRALEMHRWLQVMVKRVVLREEERIKSYYERRLDIARRQWPPHLKHKPNPQAIELLEKRETALAQLREESKEALADYRRRIPKRFSLLDLYQGFYEDVPALISYVEGLTPEIAAALSKRHGSHRSRLVQEDLALLLRLKELLHGLQTKCALTVIDEAQDMNPTEFLMLRSFLQGGSAMTAVGDLAQRIYPQRGLDDWTPLLDQVLAGREIVYREMHRSYRSSAEIVAVANHLLLDQPNLTLAEAVRHTGELPYAQKVKGGSGTVPGKVQAIAQLLNLWQQGEVNSVAIMAKSLSFCRKLYQALQDEYGNDLCLIATESDSYNKKIAILPVHLAKGLEFDAAIVADAESSNYGDGLTDRALLYVALTRPLHHLAYLYAGELTPFLQTLPPGLTQLIPVATPAPKTKKTKTT